MDDEFILTMTERNDQMVRHLEDLRPHFESLVASMKTLLWQASNGESWGEPAKVPGTL